MGNIGSVDLEELKKAREELNRERGIENDPNMYKDYNPDRVKEESVSDESQEQSFAVNENIDNGYSENYKNITDTETSQFNANAENLSDYTENLNAQNYNQNAYSENGTQNAESQSFDDEERVSSFDEKPAQGLDLSQFEVNAPRHEESNENFESENSESEVLENENSQSLENNVSSSVLEENGEQAPAPQTQSMSKEEVQAALQAETGEPLNEEAFDEDYDEEDDDFDIDDFFNKIIGEGANSLSDEDLEEVDDESFDDEESSEESTSETQNSVENSVTETNSVSSVSETSNSVSEESSENEEIVLSQNEPSDFDSFENKSEQKIEPIEESQVQSNDSTDDEKDFGVYDNFAEFEVKGYQNYQTKQEDSVTENTASENSEPEQTSETFASSGNEEDSLAENEQKTEEEKFFVEENSESESYAETDSSVETESSSESGFDLNEYLNKTNSSSEENSQEEIVQKGEETEIEEVSKQDVQQVEPEQAQATAAIGDETQESETPQTQAEIENLQTEEISEENTLEDETLKDNSELEIQEDEADVTEAEAVQALEDSENEAVETLNESEAEIQDDAQTAIDVNAKNFNDYEDIYGDIQNVESLSENKVEEKNDEVSADLFEKIKDYKFVDVLETEEFKSSEKLSYVFGKDSDDRLMFMNMRDMFNTVMFGLNEKVMFEHISSMLLSLALKNTINDINFVICDSKLESDYEVFNKSSYMFFNRVAKTNREILDTLIELESELDQRYNTLVGVGARSIEHYNKFAAEADISAMPYIVLVLNNYTRAASMVLGEQINICLSNILKLGRIVGIYAVVVAYENIENAEINFNLPGRLAYKTENAEISEFEVGSDDATKLASDDEFVYTSVKADEVFHLKTPRLGVNEVNLIIENLEN